MEEKNPKNLIIENLREKASIKQLVFDNTKKALSLIKSTLEEVQKELNFALKDLDNRILLEYTDKGEFETELTIAGDLLLFSMHSNIFDFEHSHKIHQLGYVRKERLNSYCGIIHVYNFLTDSFKYNRKDDLGYLIARIFINRENHFFVEGKRQIGYLFNDFANKVFDKETVKQIIFSLILYSLDFDLLVPPYENVTIVSVEQIIQKLQNPKFATGKRLGFQFNYEDIKDNEP